MLYEARFRKEDEIIVFERVTSEEVNIIFRENVTEHTRFTSVRRIHDVTGSKKLSGERTGV